MQNKNIWITGASSGIGYETAKLLSEYPTNNLIFSARNSDKLTKIATSLTGNSKKYVFPMDVSSIQSIKDAFLFIENEVGDIDILINNAGNFISKSFIDSTADDFETIINTNLRGCFNTTQCVLPAMLEKQNGIIINIVSITAIESFTNSSIYSASKAALLAMMNSLREEVREYNIKIINILPGAVATNIWHPKMLEKKQHLMATPKDIANVIVKTIELCETNTAMIEEIIVKPQNGSL